MWDVRAVVNVPEVDVPVAQPLPTALPPGQPQVIEEGTRNPLDDFGVVLNDDRATVPQLPGDVDGFPQVTPPEPTTGTPTNPGTQTTAGPGTTEPGTQTPTQEQSSNPEQQEPQQGFPLVPVLLGTVAGLAAIASAIFFLLGRRRDEDSDEVPEIEE